MRARRRLSTRKQARSRQEPIDDRRGEKGSGKVVTPTLSLAACAMDAVDLPVAGPPLPYKTPASSRSTTPTCTGTANKALTWRVAEHGSGTRAPAAGSCNGWRPPRRTVAAQPRLEETVAEQSARTTSQSGRPRSTPCRATVAGGPDHRVDHGRRLDRTQALHDEALWLHQRRPF